MANLSFVEGSFGGGRMEKGDEGKMKALVEEAKAEEVKTEENRNETSDEIKQYLQISKLPHLAISAFLCLSFSTRSAFPRAMISSLFLPSSCTNNQD